MSKKVSFSPEVEAEESRRAAVAEENRKAAEFAAKEKKKYDEEMFRPMEVPAVNPNAVSNLTLALQRQQAGGMGGK